uniref:Uncharacterized protein n=1 Tax=Enterovibrio norvegicus TaxID=188144 RepID=A0A0H3ZUZ1_9GAMM|nr:hypothetical protein [Enterovibrio norvegicus]
MINLVVNPRTSALFKSIPFDLESGLFRQFAGCGEDRSQQQWM